MARYIDADAFRHTIMCQPKNMSVNYVLELISKAPTADVVERKKGKWKPFDRTWGRSIYHCTACGEAEDCPTVMGKVIWPFCPNCGAEMSERREE